MTYLVATSNRRANAVATLPGEVCGLTLSLLDLTNNELTALPPKLGTMTTLRRLVLDGNPLRSLPHSVLAGPISKLLESLRKKLPEDDARGNAAPAVRSGNVFGEDERRHAVAAAQRVASAAAPSTLSLAGGYNEASRTLIAVSQKRSLMDSLVTWTAATRLSMSK